MLKHNTRSISMALVGTLIESFDNMLYVSFLFILMPLFFPHGNPVVSRMLALSGILIAYLARPLGAILFGLIGDKKGRKTALGWAIALTSIPTICIGFLPTYNEIGIFAPILLLLCRITQTLFASAETSGAAVFLTEHALPWNKSFISSFFNMSIMMGCFFASVVGYFSINLLPEWGWRIPFILGGAMCFFGFFLRLSAKETPAFSLVLRKNLIKKHPLRNILQEHRKNLLCVMGISSGTTVPFYMIYIQFPEILVQRFKLTDLDILLQNIALMVFSICLLPFVGKFADWYGRKKTMLMGAFGLFALSYSIFQFAENTSSLERLVCLRFLLEGVSLLVAAPACAFIAALFPVSARYTGFSLGWSLGAVLFAATTPLASKLLVDWTRDPAAAGGYLALCGGLCWFSLLKAQIYSQGTEQEITEYHASETAKAA